jgi:hypothetical protein
MIVETSMRASAHHKSPMPDVMPLAWTITNYRGLDVHLGRGLGLQYQVACKTDGSGWVTLLGEELVTKATILDERSAKAVAQSDYETRVRSVLMPTAQDVPAPIDPSVRHALTPFSKAWMAMDNIAKGNSNSVIDEKKVVVQTWGQKDSVKDASIVVGDLKRAFEVLNGPSRGQDDQDRAASLEATMADCLRFLENIDGMDRDAMASVSCALMIAKIRGVISGGKSGSK